MKPIIFTIIFVVLLVFTIRIVFRKSEIHYQLIKLIYPGKFDGVNSIYKLMASLSYFKLSASDIIWLASPIYFRKEKVDLENEQQKMFDQKLFANNKMLLISVLFYILWIFMGSTFFL